MDGDLLDRTQPLDIATREVLTTGFTDEGAVKTDIDEQPVKVPLSPRTHSYTTLVLEMMEQNPRLYDAVSEAVRSPSRMMRWRRRSRRTFYVVVVIVLAAVIARLHTMEQQQQAHQRQEADAMVELVRRSEIASVTQHALQNSLQNSAEKRAMQTSVAINAGLMLLNCVLAVRGVQIWQLMQRVGVEGWIRAIASHMPWTRRVCPPRPPPPAHVAAPLVPLPPRRNLSRKAVAATFSRPQLSRVVGVVTRPVRQALRAPGAAVRLPFRQAAIIRAAAERAAEREAAAAAAAKLPWRVAYRKMLGVASFVDRTTGGVGSWMRHALPW